MEHSIYKYILRYSKKQQIILTLMSILSFPALYYYLELPKIIINQAIQADDIAFPVEYVGVEFDQTDFLYLTVGLFLLMVIVNQAFKYVINVYQGITGEQMLRRLRYELYCRILRFPLPTFKKKSAGEIIPMITGEVEPLGGFIGEAFALPIFQGGYLVVIVSFLVVQNWIMAVAAIALYPLQAYFIPILQKKVNLLGKTRVRLVRVLSDQLGESVSGVEEVHAHDGSNFMRANFSNQLDKIYVVRYRIYLLKFVIKFLNNFIQQLGPFFFYAIGGTMVINGTLEVGTLVAAIGAHKEMAAPWKELLAYYQRREDARIKYEQVVEQFEPAGMRDEDNQLIEPEEIPVLTGEFVAGNVELSDDTGNKILDGLSTRFRLDERIAVIGPAGSGREALTHVLSRLIDPDRGRLTAGKINLVTAPEAIVGRKISYVGQHGYVFNTTLGENLFFGLKHRPLHEKSYEGEEAEEREAYIKNAQITGNSADDIEADWHDYALAGVKNKEELNARALEVLEMVDLSEDVYRLGLRSTIDPKEAPETAELVLNARRRFFEKIETDPSLKNMIEAFEQDSYNTNASVAENLLFGTPVGDDFDLDRMAENKYVQKIIEEAGLTETFLKMGYQVATLMIELFADLPPDHEFFQLYGFISSDDLPEYQAMLSRIDSERLDSLKEEDRLRFMSLPFKVIPSRHRLGVLTDDIEEKIVAARHRFAEELPPHLKDSVAFFDADAYNPATNLQDNILFGKIAFGYAQAAEKIGAVLADVVQEMSLRSAIIAVGLNFAVGSAGARLNATQRQKLCIARAIIKKPDVLILNQATSSFDTATQTRLMKNILEEFEGRCLIWSLDHAEKTAGFDHVLVMRSGRVVEQGNPEKLKQGSGPFKEMLSAS
ncbi:ATP-binding cassette domain-containing protein [Sneathiella chungangensis]|uniref:ATP-binding cassette domain-containing protein n=1 Tax=Sneathiella chungangensis TaxID=1418234 RepID=A0A845MJD6_9PROT|nr:ABC transporter transmembrane domain-containing protein [Sneathiella chungangensis]MZR24173.1 ATP-binding cassette domain-containing protein [Sneathiella chungangensis]